MVVSTYVAEGADVAKAGSGSVIRTEVVGAIPDSCTMATV